MREGLGVGKPCEGGGGCDLLEPEDLDEGGGGVVGLDGFGGEPGLFPLLGGDDGDLAGGDPPLPGVVPPPPLLPLLLHFDLVQSIGFAASERHSVGERWFVIPGMQFWIPSTTTFAPGATQTGAAPVK